MAALEPLSNALARADGAQAVQALFSTADRASRGIAAQKVAVDGKQNPASVPQLDGAEGSRIREEETGGNGGGGESNAEAKPEEPAAPPATPPDPEGKGKSLDITA